MTHTILAHLLSMMTMLVAPAAADEPGAHAGRHGKGAGMCERLECTDEQRVRIDAIRDAHREDSKDERAEVKNLRSALKAEESKANPDAEELARLRAALDTAKLALEQERHETKAEVAAVLTPAQREQLAAMKAEHRKGKKGKDGKAHGKGKKGERGKAHAKLGKKADKGERGKAHAKARKGDGAERGKAHAKARRGDGAERGKAHAKAKKGARGKAHAKLAERDRA